MPAPRKKAAGRPKAKSGLPTPIPGEPFSLIGTLRRTTKMLSIADVAEILGYSKKTIYAQIDAGKIPEANLGFGEKRVDPKAWLHLLEHDNKHLLPSARSLSKAA